MSKRVGILAFRSSAVLMVGALIFGCQINTSTPTAKDVARWLPEFYFPVLPMTGLYLNYDTDAIIFRYSVSPNERPLWLQRISDSARANGWKVVHEGRSGDVDSLYLQRIDDPKRHSEDMHSLEIVRVTSCGSALLIAKMQADIEELSDLAEVTAQGPRWYQKRFWPLVAKNRVEACRTQ